MRSNRAFKILAALLLAVGLSACSDPPDSGYIYKMPYEGESYWYSTDCAMYVQVSRITTRNVYDSKGRFTGTTSSTSYVNNCVMWKQTQHVSPPSWQICMVDDKDTKHKGCINVPQSVYNKYTVNAHYPNPM